VLAINWTILRGSYCGIVGREKSFLLNFQASRSLCDTVDLSRAGQESAAIFKVLVDSLKYNLQDGLLSLYVRLCNYVTLFICLKNTEFLL
jgi:hypothetical protein